MIRAAFAGDIPDRPVEFPAVHIFDEQSAFRAHGFDRSKRSVGLSLRDQNLVDRAARFQRIRHRIAPVYQFIGCVVPVIIDRGFMIVHQFQLRIRMIYPGSHSGVPSDPTA